MSNTIPSLHLGIYINIHPSPFPISYPENEWIVYETLPDGYYKVKCYKKNITLIRSCNSCVVIKRK